MKKKIIIFTIFAMIVAVILFFVSILVLNVVNPRSALTGVTVVTKEEIIIEDETTAISEPWDIPETNDWGITFTVVDVTSIGLTIVCEQEGGEQQGELMTSSPYWLQVYENNSWETVEYTLQEYDVAWTSEGWIVPLIHRHHQT
ncbi:MAG: hypothetical protein R3Y24_03180 [Eubacteriales bacterium]